MATNRAAKLAKEYVRNLNEDGVGFTKEEMVACYLVGFGQAKQDDLAILESYVSTGQIPFQDEQFATELLKEISEEMVAK